MNITDLALNKVAQIGSKVSLRYALQLLAPAAVLARVKVGGIGGTARGEVGVEEVEECEGLFLDASRSAKELANENGFLV
jgi:RuvB-like protein 1